MTATTPNFRLQRSAAAELPPIVVGAGPAGVRAAATLLAHGLRPVVVDEAPRAGGQVYRQPPPGLERSPQELYGRQAGRARALHACFAAIQAQIDYRPDTLLWNAQPDGLDLLHQPTQTLSFLPWREIIVASGATDRVLPLPGWTLPGVYTLGGAQVALKSQGCAIGSAVVFAGTGPLLYLVASQYALAGAQVVAVLDTAPRAARWRAIPGMLSQPAAAAQGLQLIATLRAQRVPVHRGVQLLHIEGDARQQRVQAIVWRDHAGRQQRSACNAVGLGHALRPETQLADLLGCAFNFSPIQRCHVPTIDAMHRSSVPGVYLAGDGAAILGANAAECSGELAAWALLADRGLPVNAARIARLQRQLARAQRFRQAMEQAFPLPAAQWAQHCPGDLVICRCEHITAAQVRAAIMEGGAQELNRLKALCRVGMGRCQGRMCAPAATELLAHTLDMPVQQAGRLRAQAPIKPVPLGAALAPQKPEGTAP